MRHIALAILATMTLTRPSAVAALPEVDEAVAAGRGAVASDDDARAIALFERAVHFDPARSDAYYSLGLLYRKRERWRDALAAFRRAAVPSAPAEAHCQVGEILTEVFARPGEALAHLRRATQVDPDYARSHLLLGVALLRTGDAAAARAALQDAARLDPDNPEAAYQVGVAATRLGDLGAALRALERAIALDALHAKSYLAMGACLMRQGASAAGQDALNTFRELTVQVEEIARLERVLALDASDAELWARLGELRLARGEWTEAVASLEEALSRWPAGDGADAGIRYAERLGYAYFRLARYSDAAVAFEAVVGRAPDVAAYRNSLAGAYLMADDATSAIQQYLAALELAPTDSRLRLNLAKAYELAGQDGNAAAARAAASPETPRE